jgi:hypothetical protein
VVEDGELCRVASIPKGMTVDEAERVKNEAAEFGKKATENDSSE